jgi:hypothetical protein
MADGGINKTMCATSFTHCLDFLFFLARINAPSLLDVLRVKFINNLSQGSGGLMGRNSFADAPFGLYIIAYHV